MCKINKWEYSDFVDKHFLDNFAVGRRRTSSEDFGRLRTSSGIFGNDCVVFKNPSTPRIKISCLYLRKSWQVYLKVSVFSGCQLGEYSPKQVTRTKIFVTVASKVVTAWRVNKNLGLLG